MPGTISQGQPQLAPRQQSKPQVTWLVRVPENMAPSSISWTLSIPSLEPVPACTGHEAECTPNGLPVHHPANTESELTQHASAWTVGGTQSPQRTRRTCKRHKGKPPEEPDTSAVLNTIFLFSFSAVNTPDTSRKHWAGMEVLYST